MSGKETNANENWRFFSNRDCEYFPCHEGAAEDDFNCLFCYCPLYALGEKCGGNFVYLKNGVKDCSSCLFPHHRENYDYVTGRFSELAKLCAKKELPANGGR